MYLYPCAGRKNRSQCQPSIIKRNNLIYRIDSGIIYTTAGQTQRKLRHRDVWHPVRLRHTRFVGQYHSGALWAPDRNGTDRPNEISVGDCQLVFSKRLEITSAHTPSTGVDLFSTLLLLRLLLLLFFFCFGR